MKSKIPSLLAIFLLIAGLAAAIFIIKNIQTFRLGATGPSSPQDLKITNIKDTAFTVSWVTDNPTIGIVEYSSQGQTNKSQPTSLSKTHLITIQNLKPSSSYSFRINSAGQTFDNSGIAWQTQTTATLTPQTGQIISGQVLDQDNLPAKNALVYVSIPTGEIFSTQVTPSGNWLISLPPLADSTVLNISIEASPSLISTAKIDLKSANPTPTIVLGKSYDFSNQEIKSSSDTPKVQIDLP